MLDLGFGFIETGPCTLQKETFPDKPDYSIKDNKIGIRKNS